MSKFFYDKILGYVSCYKNVLGQFNIYPILTNKQSDNKVYIKISYITIQSTNKQTVRHQSIYKDKLYNHTKYKQTNSQTTKYV